jgi:hypothetical protein
MGQAYRGAIGRTQTAMVHVTDPRGELVAVQVTTSVDATTNPALAERLLDGTLNVVTPDGGDPIRLAVPVVYHDPRAELLALVLDDAHRHRELEERIAVLEQLRADPAAVPPYAKDFAVVFGGAGLRAALDQRGAARDGDTDRFEIAPEPSEADDPLTTELVELPIDASGDDFEPTGRFETGCSLDRTGVREVIVAGDLLARALAGALDVRLVLHRAPSYPVIALVIGAPADLRAAMISRLVVILLDIASERDRAVLHELARAFELTVVLATRGRRIRRCRLIAPLAENVTYILRAAEDHLRSVASNRAPDFRTARDLVIDPAYDLLGAIHPERGELRDDKLGQTATAQQLRRALAIARRFSRPAREDYLVCTRGFPIARWRQRRRDVLVRSVAWGMWMGPELAQIAVSEGLARSRRDLIVRLDRGFEHLRHDAAAFDLDPEAAADNAAAIVAEARGLGVTLRPIRANSSGAIASDTSSVVSGSISSTPVRGAPATRTSEDLLAELAELKEGGAPHDGRNPRLVAALALCDRADPRAAGPVVAAAMTMSRGEAVRVLAMSIKFGAAAAPALQGGLASSKAYLRHGCALALALLGSDGTADAVVALLVSEPTELWREIARAIGRFGTSAMLPLASHYGRLGDRAPLAAERVAWAMAHIAVRGGKDAVVALAAGQGVIAPVAAKALELLALAASDRVREPSDSSGSDRDLTVNHAFSRQFFDVIEQGLDEATEIAAEVVQP